MAEQPMNTKMLSLVPTNGTEFEVTQGQKVIFELPPNLGLVKGRDSYLCLDVCNTSTQQNRLGLNGSAGVDALLSRIDIYSLRDGTHLETLQHYNQWSAITHQYLFEDKTNLQSLTGCGNKVYSNDNIAGVRTPVQLVGDNVADQVLSPLVATDGSNAYNFRRYTTPLKAGIFRYWDDERLCPVLAFGGLRIEITLESPEVCLHQLQTACLSQAGTAGLIQPSVTIGDGAACANTAGFGALWTLEACTLENCGFAVGNVIDIDGDVGAGVVRLQTGNSITNMVQNGANVDVTFNGPGIAASTDNSMKLTSVNKSAKVRPQFRIVSVIPPQGMIAAVAGGLQYEFTSYDFHISSLLASATQHQVELNSVATKALCILSSFNNITGQSAACDSSYFRGSDPTQMNLNEVQYFLNNRLQPVRAYNPQVNNQRIIAQHEVAKSLNTLNYEAKDLGNTDGANLAIYTNSFLVGRQLAKRPYYYDLKDAEGQIRLGFAGVRADNHNINTFVWSKKVVNVGAGAELAVVL